MEFKFCVLDKNLVQTSDVNYYVTAKQRLIAIHGEYAKNMGVPYTDCDNYTYERAINSWLNKPRIGAVIKSLDNVPIGMLEYEFRQTESRTGIDSIYLNKCFLEPEFRGKGIFKRIVSDFRAQYPDMAIELECWYDLPANKVYRSLGFKNHVKKYILPPIQP